MYTTLAIVGMSAGAAVFAGFFVHTAASHLENRFSGRHFSIWKILRAMDPGLLARLTTRDSELGDAVAAAGIAYPITTQALIGLKRVLLWIAHITVLLPLAAGRVEASYALFIGVPVYALAMRGPELYCKARARGSQAQAERELPGLIDALILYAQAGLNIESAFAEYAKRTRGSWGEVWKRFSSGMERGAGFHDSVVQLKKRFSGAEFHRFLNMLEQSRSLGVSLTEILSIHAEHLRAKRRQKAEELARTAAVKISIPLVFFIFPAMLIMFLGPAVIQLKNFL